MSRLTLSAMLAVSLAFAGCAAQSQPAGQPKKAAQPAEPKKAVEAVEPAKPVEPKKAVEPAKPAVEPAKPVVEPKKVEPKKAAPQPVAVGKAMSLVPTKDARVFIYPQENNMNGGGGTRLRTSGIQKGSGEIVLMDFDRAAIKAFLDKNAGKEIAAKLVLQVYQVQGGGGKVEVAALDSGSDWTEGNKAQVAADKGEVTFLAAAKDEKPWTTAAGKTVKDVRELLYDRGGDAVKTMLNSKSAEVGEKDKTVTIELDAKLVEHLASDAASRGLALFNRTESAKIDFYSKEKANSAPKLELAVK